ncbi:50S ribosomal protein L17 [Listeria monocytogenes]|nr:50S ribosomal protein L17 [Listeria monocytogenes]
MRRHRDVDLFSRYECNHLDVPRNVEQHHQIVFVERIQDGFSSQLNHLYL